MVRMAAVKVQRRQQIIWSTESHPQRHPSSSALRAAQNRYHWSSSSSSSTDGDCNNQTSEETCKLESLSTLVSSVPLANRATRCCAATSVMPCKFNQQHSKTKT